MSRVIVGIMGPGEKATEHDCKNAHEVGKLAAQAGHLVMTGGRPTGVMEAGLKGAKEGGGLTLGILPSKSKEDATRYADIVVSTGMNSARNYVNALTSDVMVACGVEAGTLSEIALALKEKKHIVLITQNKKAQQFLVELNGDLIHPANDPQEAMKIIKKILNG